MPTRRRFADAACAALAAEVENFYKTLADYNVSSAGQRVAESGVMALSERAGRESSTLREDKPVFESRKHAAINQAAEWEKVVRAMSDLSPAAMDKIAENHRNQIRGKTLGPDDGMVKLLFDERQEIRAEAAKTDTPAPPQHEDDHLQ